MLASLLYTVLMVARIQGQEDLNTGWNAELGLWEKEGPGHTFAVEKLDRVHEGRATANRLLNAALLDRLPELDILAILRGLRDLQDKDVESRTFGCMRWYAEDTHVDDTNAAFFIGLPLLVFYDDYKERLSAEEVSVLHDIFGDLKTWFISAVEEHPRVYYPNKYLGDLVCAWLLLEATQDTAHRELLIEAMLESANYWTQNGWGWGEHMSDGYARVCMEEISILLCLAQELPEQTRSKYTDLLNALLRIEDLYRGGPRVPAIRSYAFTRSPKHQSFREKVRQWDAEELLIRFTAFNPGHVLQSRGWHDLVADAVAAADDFEISCFAGARATAWLQGDMRVGSLSRFPLMPSAEHHGWGLAWQSFPVAMWRPEGDWGFLQWMVKEADKMKAHPAVDWNSAYLNNAFSRTISPPIVGQTFALQDQGNLLVVRILPGTDMNWDAVSDQFRLIQNNAEVEVLPKRGPWSQALLKYEDRELSINHINLMKGSYPELKENSYGGFDWRVTWTNADMQAEPANELGKHLLISVWGISATGRIIEAPEILSLETIPMQRNPEQEAYVLKWKWPEITWHVSIDPMREEPLINLSPEEDKTAYPFTELKALPERDPTRLYGDKIRRTMHLLSTSTAEKPNKVKILFYGQSITRQDYSRKIIGARLREAFPRAQLELINPAIGGYEAPRSLLTLHHTLVPEQPDLVVFHVYGGEEDGSYEKILQEIRDKTSAEIMCVTHHIDNYGPEKDAQLDHASQLRIELAEKYGAEIVDLRSDWRRYMDMHGMEASDLLVDRIHLNAHGGELWGALQARHFEVQPFDAVQKQGNIETINFCNNEMDTVRFEKGDWKSTKEGLVSQRTNVQLTVPFQGARIDAVGRSHDALLDILLDEKKPSAIPEIWATTLPSATPIDYRPAIMRVALSGVPVAETWTVTVDRCREDGLEFSYSVRGSVSGEQGRGDHTGIFRSLNGYIEIRPEWFTMEHAICIQKSPIPVPFEITFDVYPMVPDQLRWSAHGDNCSGQYTLLQCLKNGSYNLQLHLVEGSLQLEKFIVYRSGISSVP